MEKSARRTQKITALLTGLVFAYLITGISLLILAFHTYRWELYYTISRKSTFKNLIVRIRAGIKLIFFKAACVLL